MNTEYVVTILLKAREQIAEVFQRAVGSVDDLTAAEERAEASSERATEAIGQQSTALEELRKAHIREKTAAEDAARTRQRSVKALQEENKALRDRASESRKNQTALANEAAELERLAKARIDEVGKVDSVAKAYQRQATELRRLSTEHGRAAQATERQSANSDRTIRSLDNESRAYEARASKAEQSAARVTRAIEREAVATERAIRSEENASRRRDSAAHGAETRLNRLNASLQGFQIAFVIKYAQALISTLVGLAGSFFSVASAAGVAGATLAGTFAAGAAQAIPIAGVLGSALLRLGFILKAVTLNQQLNLSKTHDQAAALKAQQSAADQVTSAQERLSDAHEQYGKAQDNVAQAEHRLTLSQADLTRAREQARRQLDDLIAAERRAQTQAEGTNLSLEDAQRNFRRALGGTDVAGLAEAENQLRAARDAHSESITGQTRAQQDANRGRRDGLNAIDSYRSAVESVHSSEQAVADAQQQVVDSSKQISRAQDDLARAHRDAATAADQETAAQDRLQEMLKQMTPTERGLFRAITRIQDTWRRVSRPITDTILGSFTRAIDSIEKVLTDSGLGRAMGELATTIAEQIDKISEFLSSSSMLSFFETMTEEASKNVPLVTDLLITLAQTFTQIAEAAGPALTDLINLFGDYADKAEDASSNTSKLSGFFQDGVKYIKAFVDLGWSAVRLLAHLSSAGAQQSGLGILQDFTREINKATAWVDGHRKEVNKFFEDARRALELTAKVVVTLAAATLGLFSTRNVETFSDFLIGVVIPALQAAIEVMGTLTSMFHFLISLPVVRELAAWAASVLLLTKGFLILKEALLSIRTLAAVLLPALAGGTTEAAAGGRAMTAAFSPWLAVAIAVAAAIALLNDKFHIFSKAIELVRGGLEWFGDFFQEHPFAAAGTAIAGLVTATIALRVAWSRFGGVITRVLESALGKLLGFGKAARTAQATSTAANAAQILGPRGQVISTVEKNAAGSAGGQAAGAAGGGLVGNALSKLGGGSLLKGVGRAGVIGATVAVGVEWAKGITQGFKTHNWGKALEDVRHNITLGLFPKGKDFDKIDKNIGEDIDRINELANAAAKAHKLGITIDVNFKKDKVTKGLDDVLNQLTRTVGQVKGKTQTWSGYFDSLQTDVGFNLKRINYLLERGQITQGQSLDLLAGNYSAAANSIAASMRDAGRVTKRGLDLFNKYLRQALDKYGMDEADINQELVIRDYRLKHGPGTGTGAATLARGGVIGGFGERGRDMVSAWLGRGEVVLNWMQQAAVNAKMQGQDTLQSVIGRVSGEHAGPGMPGTAFARGGGYGGMFGGVTAGLGKLITQLDALGFHHGSTTGGGHDPDGYHPKGMAVDYGDASNDMVKLWGVVYPMRKRFAELFGPSFLRPGPTLMHNGAGFQNGKLQADHEDHIHIALLGAVKNISRAIKAGAERAAQKIPSLTVEGPDSVIKSVMQLTLDSQRQATQQMLDRITGDSGDAGAGGAAPKGKPRDWLTRALKITGQYSAGNLNALYGRMMQESGGDPRAINLWDSNAAAGHPSKGLLQTIDSTFNSYAIRGHKDIWNPIDNAIAAIRYMLAQYGHIVGPSGTGYDIGGEIPGPLGKAFTALVHGKEWVLNLGQQEMVASLAGMTRNALKSTLGFSGTPETGYQGGGEPTATISSKRRRTAYSPTPLTNAIGLVSEIEGELNAFADSISRKGKDLSGRIRRTFAFLTDQDGPLDQLNKAIEAMVAVSTVAIQRAQFKMKGGVAKRTGITPEEIGRRQLGVLQQERTGFQQEQTEIAGGLKDAQTALRKAQRLHGAERRRAVAEARVAIRNLTTRQLEINADLAQNTQDQVEKQEEIQKAMADSINERASNSLNFIDRLQRVMAAVGQHIDPNQVLGARMKAMSDQVHDLTAPGGPLAAARASGNASLVKEIEDQVAELNTSIAEGIAQQFQNSIDAVNNTATRQLGKNDLRQRLANIGGTNFGAIGSALVDRGGILSNQRTGLLGLLGQAQAAGNVDQAEALQDSIDTLDVTIAENTQAIKDNTDAAFQSRIDATNATADFISSITGGASGFFQALGNLTGTPETAALLGIQTTAGAGLQQQQSGLKGLLADILGYNPNERGALANLSGQDLVNYILSITTGPVFDSIMGRLDPAQQEQFKNLTQGLLTNATALVENTLSIKDLTGAVTEPQQFSSSAWQWWRQAIFNGSNGLLPQYEVPQMHDGGLVTRGGIFDLRVGERVSTPETTFSDGWGDTNITVPITQPIEQVDGDQIGRRAAFGYKTSGKRKGRAR